jgi:cell division protein FtsW
MDFEKMKDLTPVFLIGAIISLFLVRIPHLGVKAGGAYRWLKIGPFSLQPFEFAKLFYAMYLAYIFSKEDIPYKKKVTRSLTMTGCVLAGLILQKDLGGSAIITGVYMVMLFITGAPIKFFLISIPAAIAGFVGLVIVEPYRMKRILVYLDPWKDYLHSGWQTAQSLIAVGTGGLFGVGLSQSQQKFGYLPDPHTDYIFSIVCEELGLWGASGVAILFFVLMWRGTVIAMAARDKFLKYLACGMTFMLGIQAYMNIGVAIGLLPSKGTTLPFFSSGGSSLMVSLVAAGILLAISKKVYGDGR